MNAIVMVDRSWGIGRDEQLLFSLPEDMARFKRMTMGRTVVMGHGTLRSLPGGRPLPGRDNIVLSRDAALRIPGARVCRSLEELEGLIHGLASDEVFLIGGQSVYRSLLGRCRLAYVTRVEAEGGADVFFPNLDAMDGWICDSLSPPVTENGLTYTFRTYRNLSAE